MVHDDLDLRLRLAGLVRKAVPTLGADTVTRAGYAAISTERIGSYAAVMFIAEFTPPEAAAHALNALTRLRELHTTLPIFVFARGGNERSAARAMKLGATDYWPIHSVVLSELAAALQPVVEVSQGDSIAPPKSDRWRQPEIAGYSLIKKLAQTSSACVYLARNAEFAKPVALKMQEIRSTPLVSEPERRRFTQECEILSRINHRSVANILDFGITDECLYLALEYFACGSLRERLKHPVSESDAVNYAHQIGEALQVVHAAHIVHRDLKPSNLMLTDENRLVLIDFGSARTRVMRADDARIDDCTGTPYYVSPEQVDDRAPDERGDLYSLGVVLFEMLAGRLPFVGKTLGDIFAQHRSAPVPRLPLPVQAYQPIIDRLMAKDPQDRYPAAAQFLDELDAVRAELKPRHRKSQRRA